MDRLDSNVYIKELEEENIALNRRVENTLGFIQVLMNRRKDDPNRKQTERSGDRKEAE